MLLWSIAVLCEYTSPMIGFALPGLGVSSTSEWTIEGGHLAERCSLFVIVALGETLLASGATLASQKTWGVPIISALLATFLGTLAMWWLYFGTASKDATERITHSDDPGRIGSYFHYVHAILVAGIIATAVGNDLVLAHPHQTLSVTYAITLSAGPALYLLGSALYKKVVYDSIPISHIAGAVALAALVPVGLVTDLLVMGWLTTIVMVAVSQWEDTVHRRRQAKAHH
jgi:low temperature requirement protein LtrA